MTDLLEIYRHGGRNSVAIFCDHRQVGSSLLTRVEIEVAIVRGIIECFVVPNVLA